MYINTLAFLAFLANLHDVASFLQSPSFKSPSSALHSQRPFMSGEPMPMNDFEEPIFEEPAPMAIKTRDMWEDIKPVQVQGGSLRTCALDEGIQRVQIFMKTEGRPLNANVDLWQGPDNAPMKMGVYLEDGNMRPFRAVFETPGDSNAIAIRNTGQLEFPLTAGVESVIEGAIGNGSPARVLGDISPARIVQGGAVYTTPFSHRVSSVQMALRTDGRPLNARIELLQGPNNNKQVMEVYAEDGLDRPFYAIVDTPGSGNVVRIVNTATVEFPLYASLEPYTVEDISPSVLEGRPEMIWT